MRRIIALSLFLSTLIFANQTSTSFPRVILDGDTGSRITGEIWDSAMLAGKTVMLFYVDPDEKSKGKVFKPTIEATERNFPSEAFQIYVVINLAATWKPDMLIESLLKDKAKNHPERAYVIDKKRTLVEKWGLPDDEYNCVILSSGGDVLFRHAGAWNDEKIARARSVLEQTVGPLQ